MNATIVDKILNKDDDFEVTRFDHAIYDNTKTSLNYEFYFNQGDATSPSWINSYLAKFTTNEVYYFEKPFTKSFFKLDFYDTMDGKSQTNYFTIIIPVQQGFTELVTLSPYIPDVLIKRPSYKLDFFHPLEKNWGTTLYFYF